MMVGMHPPLPPLITALLEPQRFPGAVAQVTLVETHISWVLLAGALAYKLKKPVKLAFLDYSTLALRHQACLDELRLNRRFAPDIYLDVLPLFNTPQDPQWTGSGEPIDYVVRMRRFDESGRLDRVCARGELQPAHLSDLAATLVAFHAAAAVAPAASRFGTPAQVMAPARDNFTELKRFWAQLSLPAGKSGTTPLAALTSWTEAQGHALTDLMQARKAAGRVREGHGDLHLANLVLIDGQVRLFDCIEFNDDLRWIDVTSDIAFTWIDLLAHAQPGLANWFVNQVLSDSGDLEAALLLRFYAVYRCLVRAKVAAIRARQTQSQADTAEMLTEIAQAQALSEPPAARLLITHGLSGCGKTWLTDRLLQRDAQASSLRLRADVERKRLFGLDPLGASGSGVNTGIYTPEAHARTYDHLHDWAGRWLRAGWSVVVDATFLRRTERDRFRALAQHTGAAFGILAPLATPEQLRERIQTRRTLARDASEASLAVLAQQQRELEPLQPDELAFTRVEAA
jgi:aminoglycoside phosphotransferase family enzyme/predicted kinase